MLKALYTSATGMKAQQTMVDTIANNIANVNTAGFKKSQANFEDLLYVTLQAPGLQRQGQEAAPIGNQVGSGARLSSTAKIHSQGTLEITNRQLDIAIDGPGLFQIQLADGSLGYTRDSTFNVNANGQVVTAAGAILQPNITLPQDTLEIQIDPTGNVAVRTASAPDTSTQVGQILLARFVNPSGLLALGGNQLRATDASGAPIVAPPGTNGTGQLQQGFIERSNVEIVNELVNLIVAQRAYEVNSRTIRTSDQMLQQVSSIVR
jgi:flagellar basal-body rod protein FlgG